MKTSETKASENYDRKVAKIDPRDLRDWHRALFNLGTASGTAAAPETPEGVPEGPERRISAFVIDTKGPAAAASAITTAFVFTRTSAPRVTAAGKVLVQPERIKEAHRARRGGRLATAHAGDLCRAD